ncbi:MAG: GGDEF domain-containing protein [Rhodospirillaceae bacterium]|nr:GGDEF domain-containing protein [Rhodospirillaceae bacterium]
MTFLQRLHEDGSSPFLPITLRSNSGGSIGGLLIAQPHSPESRDGYACELWTMEGFARAVFLARTHAKRQRANDIVVRTLSALTELLARSTGLSSFWRDLGSLMEAISGIKQVLIEHPIPDPSNGWPPDLTPELRRVFRSSHETGAAVFDPRACTETTSRLRTVSGTNTLLILWVLDESMPSLRRYIVVVLPQDLALRGAWEKQAPNFARAIANALSCLTAWEHQSEMLHKAHTLSVTDPLTRVFNRYKLEEVLSSEEHRARRYGTCFSVIMADIDLFKTINDTYGHPSGDRVLEKIAAEMRLSTRSTDVVGRWGGEEFLIVCIHTRLHEAFNMAEILRQRIAKCVFAGIGSVTVSFGISAFEDGDTASHVIARADAALYAAKRQGRNRVCQKERGSSLQ